MLFKNTLLPNTFLWNCRGRLVEVNPPVAMGVINITTDSFYAGSRHQQMNDILQTAENMLQQGAFILDLGAQSTRPGAVQLSSEEEIKKLIPAIENIIRRFPQAIISVDTFYAGTAKAAVEAGAGIVNDISAGNMDTEMLATAGKLNVPYIAMHIQGTPATMQSHPEYNDVVKEVLDFFIQKIAACTAAGIKDILIDPGFGFGKTRSHNYTLLKHLSALSILQKPLLIGISRKSMIYRLLNITADEALNATTALHILALQNGAQILRVHDVQAAMEAIRLWQYYQQQP